MAITGGVCTSYKQDLFNGVHQPGDSYYICLVTSASTISPSTTTYTGISGEVANGNGYTTGGKALTGRNVSVDTGTVCLDFTDPVWATATITARGALIYNNTAAGKNAICVLDFGQDVSSTNDNFTVDLPAAGAGTSLLRL